MNRHIVRSLDKNRGVRTAWEEDDDRENLMALLTVVESVLVAIGFGEFGLFDVGTKDRVVLSENDLGEFAKITADSASAIILSITNRPGQVGSLGATKINVTESQSSTIYKIKDLCAHTLRS